MSAIWWSIPHFVSLPSSSARPRFLRSVLQRRCATRNRCPWRLTITNLFAIGGSTDQPEMCMMWSSMLKANFAGGRRFYLGVTLVAAPGKHGLGGAFDLYTRGKLPYTLHVAMASASKRNGISHRLYDRGEWRFCRTRYLDLHARG